MVRRCTRATDAERRAVAVRRRAKRLSRVRCNSPNATFTKPIGTRPARRKIASSPAALRHAPVARRPWCRRPPCARSRGGFVPSPESPPDRRAKAQIRVSRLWRAARATLRVALFASCAAPSRRSATDACVAPRRCSNAAVARSISAEAMQPRRSLAKFAAAASLASAARWSPAAISANARRTR